MPGTSSLTIDRALLESALTVDHAEHSTADVLAWIARRREQTRRLVRRVPLAQLSGWRFDEGGNLRHTSGGFFSIEGIQVATSVGPVPRWRQPIINQPEVGILGILCQRRGGLLHLLIQAKIEPGNTNGVQLSPTIQATRSNYRRLHGGQPPRFLEHFRDPRSRVVFDQLQSEQGARFFRKRNRNVMLEIPASLELDPGEDHRWLTLGQLKQLLRHDSLINMDTRTVLSCIPAPRADVASTLAQARASCDPRATERTLPLLSSLCARERGRHTIDEIIGWLTRLKSEVDCAVDRIDLRDVDRWSVGEDAIAHREGRFFRVIGVEVEIENREVQRWHQPLIEQVEPGIVGFLMQSIDGVPHLLVQAKFEAGNRDILEMAPTVQCITGSYLRPDHEVPFLEYFTEPAQGRRLFDTMQSEEGGRFFREENRNLIVELPEGAPLETPERYIWMTLGQAKEFIRFNNYFNVEARSLIAAISTL